jgi:hypothetical protein
LCKLIWIYFLARKITNLVKYKAGSTRFQKAIDKYLDDLQPFSEEGLDHELKDEILISGLKEARRYSKKRNVSIKVVSVDTTYI